ncbi:MAG TPA: dienelactone hydrolase family protein [Myxococcota bacterium]|nr:dienelactone hydrolase family protein [Myxococcota bacterium]
MGEIEIVRERIHIPCEGESLDAELAYPADGEPETAVLLLSPHPHLGGRMENNVVRHLARRAAEAGCVTLRFDYRGVGESTLALPEGTSAYAHWEAMEDERSYEQLLPDARAAWAALREAAGETERRVLAGYSLGAILAGLLAAECNATHVLGVSPPVAKVGLDAYRTCTRPKLFVGGDDDFAFDAARFHGEFERLPEPRRFVALPGADHFFRQEEDRLYAAVAGFLESDR